jgi:hypothetical protein
MTQVPVFSSSDAVPPEILTALGGFVVAYGRMEAMIHAVFDHYSGLPLPMARLFVGGMRAGDLIATTKRVVVAQGHDQQALDDLNVIFKWIEELSKFRDAVIHQQWGLSERGYGVAPLVRSKKVEPADVTDVDASTLVNRTVEVNKIIDFLAHHLIPRETWQQMKAAGVANPAWPFPWFETPLGPARPEKERAKGSR